MKALNSVTEKIDSGWDNLAEKDRRTVVLAAPVIVLLTLYLLVFQPVQSRYNETRNYKNELSDSLIWLYENAALVGRLQNACARQRQVERGGDDLRQFASNIGRSAGVSAELRPASDGSLVTTIKGASGNRALASVQLFACNGYMVSDLELKRTDGAGTEVDLSFRLSAPPLLGGR